MKRGKGKYFEAKAKSILEMFGPKAIHGEKRIKTTYGGFRKVDIGINNPGDYDYVIFECKDEKAITGPSALDEAQGIMKDVGASRCAVITNNRASANAIKKAVTQDTDVYNLIDPNDSKIRPQLKIKVLSEFVWLNHYSYNAFLFGESLGFQYPPRELHLDNDESVHKVACHLWNANVLSHSPGWHYFEHDKFNMASAPKFGLVAAPVDILKFRYQVICKRFVTYVPLTKGVGLYDVKRRHFIPASEEVGFGPMNIKEITKPENETTKKELELRAVLVNHLTYVME